MIARPNPTAHQRVHARANRQKKQKAGIGDPRMEFAQPGKRSIKHQDRERGPVHLAHALPDGAARPRYDRGGHIQGEALRGKQAEYYAGKQDGRLLQTVGETPHKNGVTENYGPSLGAEHLFLPQRDARASRNLTLAILQRDAAMPNTIAEIDDEADRKPAEEPPPIFDAQGKH